MGSVELSVDTTAYTLQNSDITIPLPEERCLLDETCPRAGIVGRRMALLLCIVFFWLAFSIAVALIFNIPIPFIKEQKAVTYVN